MPDDQARSLKTDQSDHNHHPRYASATVDPKYYFAVCAQLSFNIKKSARKLRPPDVSSTNGIVWPQLQYKHNSPHIELAHSLLPQSCPTPSPSSSDNATTSSFAPAVANILTSRASLISFISSRTKCKHNARAPHIWNVSILVFGPTSFCDKTLFDARWPIFSSS